MLRALDYDGSVVRSARDLVFAFATVLDDCLAMLGHKHRDYTAGTQPTEQGGNNARIRLVYANEYLNYPSLLLIGVQTITYESTHTSVYSTVFPF